MQNDMLKNTVAPWEEKGQWYHGEYDCTSGKLIRERTDKFILDTFTFTTISGVVCLYTTNNKVKGLQSIIKLIDGYTASSTGSTAQYYITATGVICLPIAQSSANAGKTEFWVFYDIES